MKKSTLTRGDTGKSHRSRFPRFWPFENEQKFRKRVKLLQKSEIWQKVNITLPDTIGLRHCILRVLPAIRFWIHQQQLVHLLLNPGTYEFIIIIQVTTLITDSPLLIPTTSSSITVNALSKSNSSVHLFHDWTWNGSVFMNHNQLITPQQITKKSQAFNFDSPLYKKNPP